MSEAMKDIQRDLDAQAAALAAQSSRPGDPAPPSTPIDLDSLAEQAVEELIAAPVVGVAPAGPAQPDLAEAVQKLIEPAPTPESPATEALGIESLDAQIADLADNMIAGELAAEQNAGRGEVGAPPAPPPPAPVSSPEAVPHEAIPAPVAETHRVEAMPPPAPRRTRPERPPGPPAQVAQKPRHQKRDSRVGMGLLWLLSRPLASKSKSTRDLVGWFALVTLFNASCLWVYVLFFRSNKPPAPGMPVATASHGSDGHSDSGHGAKSDPGAKSGDHGAKPAKAKKAAKKPSAKSQSAAHGGGH